VAVVSSITDPTFASVDFTVEDGKACVGDPCTLNGLPAEISGTRNSFARVVQIETRLGCEFAWSTVARVMALNDGRFNS
jgi:hypothetical protein